DKMSQESAPFVVATSSSPAPKNTSRSAGHAVKPHHVPPSPGSPEIIITANLVSNRPEKSASVPMPQQNKTKQDPATQRRQQFAGSPKISMEGADDSSESSPVRPSISSPETSHTVSPCTKTQAIASNGHASSVQSLPEAVGPAKDTPTGPEDEFTEVEMRRKQRPLRHAQSDFPVAMTLLQQRRCSQSLADAKEHAYSRLMSELSKAQRELQLKDEECDKLSKVRYQMEEELEDLTASLFEEANRMIEVLQAEVVALKQLVLTSTPSTPNKHLHPQICDSSPKKEKEKSSKPFWKSHRRSTSHHEFTKESRLQAEEMDSLLFDDFQRWKLQPSLDQNSPFLSNIVLEDIRPCLSFRNKKLAERVEESVGKNTLTIEPIPGDSSYPRKCSLSETHKLCNYKIKLEDDEEWYSISQMCRNRIAAVCDFYTYIRYIVQGLVKSPDKDMFQEIVRLRMQMATARLGC
ncbi:hypothetical protein BaRGS_00022147, partial [Batillaria attramentaria]